VLPQDWPIVHFQRLAKLGQALKALPAQVLDHHYTYESFGSWSLVLRYQGRVGRVVYDGREDRLTLNWSKDRDPPYLYTSAFAMVTTADLPMLGDEMIAAICESVNGSGLAAQVGRWEGVAEGLAEAKPAYVMYDEFLNDMDGRRILRQCLELAGTAEAAPYQDRMAAADALFLSSTVATRHCIWGEVGAAQHGYTSKADWYYFRRPKVIDVTWPPEFHEDR
jgi:hypothetical protein